jgi:hypothetical protein
MANLAETSVWESGVYQIETTDPVLGGAPNPATGAGMSNIPHLQLARRTVFLRDQTIALQAAIDALTAQLNAVSLGRPVVAPVLVATTANITLSGLQTIDGVSVTTGRRVLVKNQTTPAQNGVYVAASGAWARATDFDGGTDIVPGTIVSVTAGTTQGETLWSLTSGQEGDTITIGSTALAFTNATALMAPLASPVFTGNPTAPTPAQFDNDTSLATTAFVQRALGNFADAQTFSGSFTLTAADAGKCYVYGETVAATITLPAISATAIGATFEFINTGTANITVQRAGSDQIDSGPTAVNSIVVPPNQSLKIVRSGGSSLWHPVGVTAQAKLSQPVGDAPAFFARAWVNFNGIGTVAIRGSGNVSSITDNGVGDYTINFITPMPDVNYCVLGFASYTPSGSPAAIVTNNNTFAPALGSVRVMVGDTATGSWIDSSHVHVAVFR